MSLAQLLASSDSGVRSRAIAMLASILETQPLAILSSFGTYMPFFLSALRNRAQDSVTFCTLNELLVEAIMAKSAEVEPNSRVLLVEYLSRCLARAVDSGRVNAFVRHMFEGVAEEIKAGVDSRSSKSPDSKGKDIDKSRRADAQKYLQLTCVNRLVGDSMDEKYFTSLLRVLAHVPSLGVCRRLGAHVPEVAAYVIAHPAETVGNLSRCLMCDDQRSDVAVDVLLKASEKSAEVRRLLLPMVAPLRTHPLYVRHLAFKELRTLLLDSVRAGGVVVAQRDPAPFEPMASVVFADKVFESVDPSSASKWVRERTQTTIQSELKAGTLAACLDEISKGVVQGAQVVKVQGHREKEIPIEKKPVAAPQILRTMASKKKTSGIHFQTQRRKFEFYPTSRCLVWRADHSTDVVKGVLMFGPDTKIEKTSAQVLTIKTQDKTHQISFDKDSVADEWFQAMSACT